MTLEIASVRVAGAVLNADVDWRRGRVAVVAYEPDGLAVFEITERQLRPIRELGALAQPPDGDAATDAILPSQGDVAISVGWDRPLRVWSLSSGALVREFGDAGSVEEGAGRQGFYTGVLSTCGRYLDTHNLALGHQQRFDWSTGEHVADRWGDRGPMTRHPDRDLVALAVGAEASIAYFMLCDGPATRWASVAINLWVPCGLAFATGALAGVGGQTAVHAVVYDFPELTPRFTIIADPVDEDIAAEFGVSQALAWSSDARTLYIPGGDGEIVALDATDGREQHRWRAHAGMVTQLIHHPTEPRLLSAGLDGRIAIHETQAADRREAGDDVDRFVQRYPLLDVDPLAAGDERMTYLDAPDYVRAGPV